MTRSANDSHVRLRTHVLPLALPRAADIEHLDAQDLLDELCEDQLTLSMNLTRLQEAVAATPRDASAHAALRTLEARLADLGALRDALARVQLATVDLRLQRLVVPESPSPTTCEVSTRGGTLSYARSITLRRAFAANPTGRCFAGASRRPRTSTSTSCTS